MGMADVVTTHKSFDALAATLDEKEAALVEDKPPVTALLDRILIEPIDVTMKNGIILTAGATVPGPRYGEVVAIGPGRASEWNAALIPMPVVEVGDTVLYHGGAGTEWEGKRWILPGDLIGLAG